MNALLKIKYAEKNFDTLLKRIYKAQYKEKDNVRLNELWKQKNNLISFIYKLYDESKRIK